MIDYLLIAGVVINIGAKSSNSRTIPEIWEFIY